MHANNETGVIQPVRELADVARAAGALLFVDAAQTVGKIPVNVDDLGADLLALAGHKFYAPKGVGALYVRRGVVLESHQHGAGHESGRRAGTTPAPLLAALGAACALAAAWLSRRHALAELRDGFWRKLRSAFGDRVVCFGESAARLPNTLFVGFVDRLGAEVLAAVPEIAASTGSACHTGASSQSPVLAAMGVPERIGRGAVRWSLGRESTPAELDRAAELLAARLR
jgi:cysteine desulfurase